MENGGTLTGCFPVNVDAESGTTLAVSLLSVMFFDVTFSTETVLVGVIPFSVTVMLLVRLLLMNISE